jgi:DNA-binding CsgD family transcriptional regulator
VSVESVLNAPRKTGAGRGADPAEGVCIANLSTGLRIQEANGDFLRRVGRTPAELYGRHFADFVPPDVRAVLVRQLAGLAEGRREGFGARLVNPHAVEAVLSGSLTAIAVRGGSDTVTALVMVVRPDRPVVSPRSPVERGKLLSELDAKVLEGIAAGISTVQLASRLYLSRQGIEYHVATMMRRFKSPNRSALVSKAYSLGILCVEHWPPKVTPRYIRGPVCP